MDILTGTNSVVRRRNAEIDFYRLLMTIVVVIFHGSNVIGPNSRPISGGYLPVEFFLILSGYLAVKKAMENPDASYKYALLWTIKKYGRIYSYVFPIGVAHILIYAFINNMTLYQTAKWLLHSIYQLLLLRQIGIGDDTYYLFGNLWYLSAMLFVLPLFYAALIKSKDFLLYVAAPASILLVYGYYCVNGLLLPANDAWLGICYLAIPRTWAGLCGGGVCYLLSDALRKRKWTARGSVILSIVQCICMILAALYIALRGWSDLDYLCVGLFYLIIAMSAKSSIHSIFPSFFSKTADYSLALYVAHGTQCQLLPPPWAERIGPYLAIAFVYAFVWWQIISFIRKRKILEKIKRVLWV